MEEKLRTIKNIRTLATVLCGTVAIFLLMQLGPWLDKLSTILALLIGSGVFVFAGVVGCAITPERPFRAASTVVIGVFVGILTHIIVYPSLNGFERNLFPLEIVANTLWAAIFCFLTAAFWRLSPRRMG